MVKFVDGVAERVFPWFKLASYSNKFEIKSDKNYLTSTDFVNAFTEEALDILYDDTAEQRPDWNGSFFDIKVIGGGEDIITITDTDLVGYTLEEVALTVFDKAMEWFDRSTKDEE